jgi:hypothetical protein
MEALYEAAGQWTDAMAADMWHKWLWGYDCNEPPLEVSPARRIPCRSLVGSA